MRRVIFRACVLVALVILALASSVFSCVEVIFKMARIAVDVLGVWVCECAPALHNPHIDEECQL